MLSKLLHPIGHEYRNEFINTTPTMTYREYYKNNIDFKKYKIVQLKELLKSYRLRISGAKNILISRITEHFYKCIKAVLIQKVFRSYITKKSLQLRGNGFRDRNICVNDSDFYSLEPIREISFKYFFTFTCGKFTYGCNLISLIHLLKNKTVVKNPYNRENISLEIIQDILKLYDLINIIYGLPEDTPIVNTDSLLAIYKNINRNQRIKQTISNTNINMNINNEIYLDRKNKLISIRTKPVLTRVIELFMDIDQLGNYTHYEWFINLERRDYIRLYRILYDIWNVRGQLSREIKQLICVLDDPFHEIHRQHIYFNDASIEDLREICLKIFEYMIYCGVDDEYRKIGTLHALSALTVVSNGARNALPWLYESLYN